MKKSILFMSFVTMTIAAWAYGSVTCPSQTVASANDYFLNNVYYAVCTSMSATKDNQGQDCYSNADGFIKVVENKFVDFHWDGASNVIFNNINMSEAGTYTLTYLYRSGSNGSVNVIVNGTNVGSLTTTNTNWADGTVQMQVTLKAGSNTIKIGKKSEWPQSYGIQLSKQGGGDTPTVEINVDCPEKSAATANDYYLSHPYYALCTSWTPKMNGKEIVTDGGQKVLVNTAGALFKLTADGKRVDFHWDDATGVSAIIFDNINISSAGAYTLSYHYQAGSAGSIKVYVNGLLTSTPSTPATSGDGEISVTNIQLIAGSNTIKIEKNKEWPQSYYIQLTKGSSPGVDIKVDCPDKTVSCKYDYYIDHIYYALCTEWTTKMSAQGEVVKEGGLPVLQNKNGDLFRLYTDGKHVTWSPNDDSGCIIFDKIYVNTSGKYDVIWYQQNGGTLSMSVNGTVVATPIATGNDSVRVKDVTLLGRSANVIKLAKLATSSPRTLGIQIAKQAGPSALKEQSAQEDNAVKFIHDGHLYIQKNDKLYTIHGVPVIINY